MAAYATSRLEPLSDSWWRPSNRTQLAETIDTVARSSLLDALIEQLAECVAERLAAVAIPRQACEPTSKDEWFDSRHAAEYLGVHRDTLRKLAAERAIPSEQDGPGCKLYFRRSDLDAWRGTGGRPRHLASRLALAA